jgi:hypothetical protein
LSRKAWPEITLTVTEDHFKRAVPGDQCHCTIGESVHDALNTIIPALGLSSVDASTIAVNPAEAGGEPCVGVSFVGTSSEGEEVHARFLLQETAAFKVAYTTDNRSTAQMRRSAARSPYVLHASELRVRKSRVGATVNGGRPRFTPKGHIKALAGYAVREEASPEAAVDRVMVKLDEKKAAKTLPYKLTQSLRQFAEKATQESWEAKGTQTPRMPSVKVYRNRRFHG